MPGETRNERCMQSRRTLHNYREYPAQVSIRIRDCNTAGDKRVPGLGCGEQPSCHAMPRVAASIEAVIDHGFPRRGRPGSAFFRRADPTMADDQTRSIRLRGVRVHNLKGIDLDLPLDRLIVFLGRQRVGQELARFRHALCRGTATLHRDIFELYPPVPRRSSTSPTPTGSTAFRPPSPSPSGVAAAVGPEHGGDGHRGPRPPRPALRQARPGRSARIAAGRSQPADPATVARAIDGLPGGTRYLIAFPLEVRPDSDRAALADGLREDGFTRVTRGRPVVEARDGPLPIRPKAVRRRGRRPPDPRAPSRRSGGSTRSRRPSPRGSGGARVLVETRATGRSIDGWRCAGLRTRLRRARPSAVPLQQPARGLSDLRRVTAG